MGFLVDMLSDRTIAVSVCSIIIQMYTLLTLSLSNHENNFTGIQLKLEASLISRPPHKLYNFVYY